MRAFFVRLLSLIIPAAALAATAHAQGAAVYVVTYVEVMPNAADAGAALLKHYRDASRKEPGNLAVDGLQEVARSNRFAIVESWTDSATLDAHAKAASSAQFRDQLKAIQDAPPDVRITRFLSLHAASGGKSANAIYVITHVDVTPPGKDECLALLGAMSRETPSHPGNILYDVLQQEDRSNHFTVIEGWQDRSALDAHAMAAPTRAFRESLAPLIGALYDERFYTALD